MNKNTDHNTMVNNRYILGEQLFAKNNREALFRARDSKVDKVTKQHKVLIHFFSAEVMDYELFKQASQELKIGCYFSLHIQVLRLLDCGWIGDKAFFVLEEPDAWSLKSLRPAKGRLSSLHQRACSILAELNKHHLLHQSGLDSTFFVVTPGARLYLLETALSRQIQALQTDSPGWLPVNPGQVKSPEYKTWLFWPLLGVLGLAVAMGGGYSLWGDKLFQIQWQDKLNAIAVDDMSQANTDTDTEVAPEAQAALIIDTPADSGEAAGALNLVPVTSPASSQADSGTNDSGISNATVTTTVSDQPAKQAFKWNGMDAQQLLERARGARDRQRLQSALYFMRILWRNQLQTEGVQQLAQQIRESYLADQQEALEQGDTVAAQVAAGQLERLVEEFGLSADE